MNSEHQNPEEYYESLKIKYPDVNQQVESLIQSKPAEALVKFEMLFQHQTHEDALKLPQKFIIPPMIIVF